MRQALAERIPDRAVHSVCWVLLVMRAVDALLPYEHRAVERVQHQVVVEPHRATAGAAVVQVDEAVAGADLVAVHAHGGVQRPVLVGAAVAADVEIDDALLRAHREVPPHGQVIAAAARRCRCLARTTLSRCRRRWKGSAGWSSRRRASGPPGPDGNWVAAAPRALSPLFDGLPLPLK